MQPGNAIAAGRLFNRPDRAVLVILSFLLAGCGTDVKRLIGEETRMAWDAHQVAMDASELEPGLEEPIFAAEMWKLEACEEINQTVAESIERGGIFSFGEQFLTDLSLLAAYMFPLTSVERCAKAHDHYKQEFVSLRKRLESHDRQAL